MMPAADLLRHLVELESPTGDDTRIAHIGAFLAAELAARGGDTDRADGVVRAEWGEGDGGLLLLAHMDTVWPAGTLQRLPFRIDDGLAYGPGALDMKGGIVVLLKALEQVRPIDRRITVLVTADEEIGSPRGRAHVDQAARSAAVALVLEPPVRDHTFTTERSGLARYALRIEGKAAHAGRQDPGVSAIEELAYQTLALHRLRDPERGVRVNVGLVGGGTGENVIAAEAWAKIDARAWTADDQRRLEEAIYGLTSCVAGSRITVTGAVTRPPMIRTRATARLAATAIGVAERLGLPLSENASGGGSDGNFAAAAGIPVLDGLGPLGAGAHADDERVSLESIDRRAELLAGLIREL
jgi:glutamate carboxypeptidase